MRTTRNTITALVILVAAFGLAGCRRGEADAGRQAASAAQCPKLEGAYFGSDKSEVRKGEAVRLTWRLPKEYAGAARIEGLPDRGAYDSIAASRDAGATAGPFYEEKLEGVTLPITTTLKLKAEGPRGCEPLELSAPVKVVE